MFQQSQTRGHLRMNSNWWPKLYFTKNSQLRTLLLYRTLSVLLSGFKVWPDGLNKNLPKSSKICPTVNKLKQNLLTVNKIWPKNYPKINKLLKKTFKETFSPRWQNFAQSGHTDSVVLEYHLYYLGSFKSNFYIAFSNQNQHKRCHNL